jgi:two-component system NarL family sensor kinase
VTVTLTNPGKQLRVDIQDDGIGFDRSRTLEGNGLANMQKRAAHLGGEWRVQSEPGKGTLVTFTIPLA